MKKLLLWLLFAAFISVMLWLLLFGRTSYETSSELTYEQLIANNINLTPFRSIGNLLHAAKYYWQNFGSDYYIWFAVKNIGGNLILFVPLGCFLPAFFKCQRNYFVFLLTVVLSVGVIEVVQLYTLLGSLDIDDLILNTVGASIGFVFWLIFRKKTLKPQ